MDNLKQSLLDSAKSAKFAGISFHFNATEDSRLEVNVDLKGSIDLPGDTDKVVAQMLGLLGMGNSQSSLPSGTN